MEGYVKRNLQHIAAELGQQWKIPGKYREGPRHKSERGKWGSGGGAGWRPPVRRARAWARHAGGCKPRRAHTRLSRVARLMGRFALQTARPVGNTQHAPPLWKTPWRASWRVFEASHATTPRHAPHAAPRDPHPRDTGRSRLGADMRVRAIVIRQSLHTCHRWLSRCVPSICSRFGQMPVSGLACRESLQCHENDMTQGDSVCHEATLCDSADIGTGGAWGHGTAQPAPPWGGGQAL